MAQATMFQTVPRRAAKVTRTARPAMLRSRPVPWVMVLASSSTGMRFMGGWGDWAMVELFRVAAGRARGFRGSGNPVGESEVSSKPNYRSGLTSVLGDYL